MIKIKTISIFITACLFVFCELVKAQEYCEPNWRHTTFGYSFGFKGMVGADLNGDDIPEILVHTRDIQGWYILNYDVIEGDYKIVWRSRPYLEWGISNITLIDWDEDGDLEIFVSDRASNTEIYDGQSLEVITSFEAASGYVTNLLFEDADNDGEKEIVISTEHSIYIVNATTLEVDKTLGIEARNVAVGQVDDDEDLEIINSDGDVYQLNGDNLVLEWNAFDIGDFFNVRDLKLLQIDDDPALEILIYHGSIIEILDVEEQAVKYIADYSSTHEILIIDSDNSTYSQIYISRRSGILRLSHDLLEEEQLIAPWLNGTNDDIVGFVVIDSDNDGELNIVFSEDGNEEDYIKVFDMESGAIQWSSVDINGPFTAIEYIPSTNKVLAFGGGIGRFSDISPLIELDAHTGEVINIINADVLTGSFTDIFSIRDVHGMEKVKLSPDLPEQLLVYGRHKAMLLNTSDYSIEKEYLPNSFFPYVSAEVADLNGDGVYEILLGDRFGVTILDSNLEVIDNIVQGFETVLDIKAVNIDEDEALEIVIANEYVHVYDDDLQILWRSDWRDVTGMDITDWDKDGVKDVVFSTDNGGIHFNSLDDFEEFHWFNIEDFEAVIGVHIVDLNGDGVDELVVLKENNSLYVVDDTYETFLIREDGSNLSENDYIEFEDLDLDGKDEIIYANGYSVSVLPSNCYTDYITSIEDERLTDIKINVFPNPTTDEILIDLNNKINFTVELIDRYSNIVLVKKNSNILSLKQIESGIYFLRIVEENSGNVYIKKIIKL